MDNNDMNVNLNHNISEKENINNLNDNSKKRKVRKIMLLILIIFVTTIVLIAGTYAWFIGTTPASVNQFSVTIKPADGLLLSLNASNWYNDNLLVNNSTVTSAYTGNKNMWVKTAGLSPISSTGQVDTTYSRMILYEKTALAGTAGGYRLVASRIDNSISESNNYITFDLFIKNGSDSSYIETFNADDDEPIYISRESSVDTSTINGVTGDKGLKNSIRVGFRQIGRIASNGATAADAIAITCASVTGSVTGLCSNTTTTIWEPNDLSHTLTVRNFFNAVCKQRTGAATYGSACATLTDNSYSATYAVNSTIGATDNVDIYDGINTYTATSSSANRLLYNVHTLTDSMINTNNFDTKEEAFKLAPNSITKVRVYIWLEGQDVDNFDLVVADQSVDIKFGITKNKFETAPSA